MQDSTVNPGDPVVMGIDVSKATLSLAIIDNGEVRNLPEVANNMTGIRRLWRQAKKAGATWICLEPTGHYGRPVADGLAALGGVGVAIVDPLKVKRHGESRSVGNKTDAADAAQIADFARRNPDRLREHRPEPPERQQLREIRKLLEARKKHLREEQQRMEGLCNPRARELARQDVRRLTGRVEKLQGELKKAAQQGSNAQHIALLESIPGVGLLTAVAALAEDLDRCDNVRAMQAMHGLCPYIARSGTSLNASWRRRDGRTGLRRAMHMNAPVAMRYNPVVREFSARLLERGLPRRKVITASRRKLAAIMFGVLKSGRPFDPCYAGRTDDQ